MIGAYWPSVWEGVRETASWSIYCKNQFDKHALCTTFEFYIHLKRIFIDQDLQWNSKWIIYIEPRQAYLPCIDMYILCHFIFFHTCSLTQHVICDNFPLRSTYLLRYYFKSYIFLVVGCFLASFEWPGQEILDQEMIEM